MDDILDYTADASVLGKPAGSDLKDGQVTIPVLHAQEALKGTEAYAEFTELISQIASGEDKLSEVISYISSTKAIAKSQATAALYVERAKQALSPLNDSEYKTALLDLADFVLSRSH